MALMSVVGLMKKIFMKAILFLVTLEKANADKLPDRP